MDIGYCYFINMNLFSPPSYALLVRNIFFLVCWDCFLYCSTIKPRFLWPGLHIGLCVEPALLWVIPCCYSAPTILKGQRERNDALVVEGGSRGNGEIPVISPEVLDFPSLRVVLPCSGCRGEIPQQGSMGLALTVQEAQN